MASVDDLLALAAEHGISVRWDGETLRVKGGTHELRQAIGTRKTELGRCEQCQAAIVPGTVHCIPAVRTGKARAGSRPGGFLVRWGVCPTCGSDTVTDPTGPEECAACRAGRLIEDTPQAAEWNAAIFTKAGVTWQTCGSCFRRQRRAPDELSPCLTPGCGNRSRWIATCDRCGTADARPGHPTCALCAND